MNFQHVNRARGARGQQRSRAIAKHTDTVISFFLACFPDFYSATHLTHLAREKCARHGLTGPLCGEGRFHVSLYNLLYEEGTLVDFVRQVGVAVEQTANLVPPFEVRFNRVGSFENKSGNRPFVFLDHNEKTILQQFWGDLGAALRDSGFRCGKSGFLPHVTLLYDQRSVAEEEVETVSWVVNEFVLVRSFVGETKYDFPERWRLCG